MDIFKKEVIELRYLAANLEMSNWKKKIIITSLDFIIAFVNDDAKSSINLFDILSFLYLGRYL